MCFCFRRNSHARTLRSPQAQGTRVTMSANIRHVYTTITCCFAIPYICMIIDQCADGCWLDRYISDIYSSRIRTIFGVLSHVSALYSRIELLSYKLVSAWLIVSSRNEPRMTFKTEIYISKRKGEKKRKKLSGKHARRPIFFILFIIIHVSVALHVYERLCMAVWCVRAHTLYELSSVNSLSAFSRFKLIEVN